MQSEKNYNVKCFLSKKSITPHYEVLNDYDNKE